MGRCPVPATKIALQRAGLTLDYIDLIEVNEAFAAQYLAVEKELALDREKVRGKGGAIALGHPLGATGTRLVITLLYELRRRKKKYGLATACIGGGQGLAMVGEGFQGIAELLAGNLACGRYCCGVCNVGFRGRFWSAPTCGRNCSRRWLRSWTDGRSIHR